MFFDAETANSKQQICQIGYLLTDSEGNPIGEPVSQLIDPECPFDRMNVKINGITKEKVKGMPTIAEFCQSSGFLNLLKDFVFVAHNAKGADRHYLYKSLTAHKIDMPTISIIDTQELSANFLGMGRLVYACDHYGIPLEKHHDALVDATACKDLFFHLASEYEMPEPIEWIPGEASETNRSYLPKPIDGLGFTNRTHQPIKDVLEEFSRIGLLWGPNDIESLDGLRIVVTGVVPGYVGDSIEDELKSLGAKPAKTVSSKTQVVAIGHNAGMSKIDPAREKKIPIMAIADLLEVINR
jgi:DNA polymerase III epsilon subunit-like protein